MNLSYDQIVTITQGVVYLEKCSDGIRFHRFTAEQEAYYAGSQFHPKEKATAGVRMCFRTNSTTLGLKVRVEKGSTRDYFSHDVLVNGRLIGYLGNFNEEDMVGNYADLKVPMGVFEGKFNLGLGQKEVCIHLPWSVCSILQELSLDDGAFLEPVKKSKKLIAFGDSITQGYDSLHPSNRYIAQLSDAMDAEEACKAIGGECFCPKLVKLHDNITPDYITVAYGTNDWRKTSLEDFKRRCREFFEELVHVYPNAEIFVITPIWRKDCLEEYSCGLFDDMEIIIRNITKNYDNITCISGRKAVPEDENMYGDLRLHPNDKGFLHYYKSIVDEVLKNV